MNQIVGVREEFSGRSYHHRNSEKKHVFSFKNTYKHNLFLRKAFSSYRFLVKWIDVQLTTRDIGKSSELVYDPFSRVPMVEDHLHLLKVFMGPKRYLIRRKEIIIQSLTSCVI